MEIQKYKAIIADTYTNVVGYITEGMFNGVLKNIISVTEVSMPNSTIRGCFIVENESIEKFYPCVFCGLNQVKKEYLNSACSETCYNEL